MELVEIIKVGARLGECVLWCDRAQAVWWTDIEGRALYRCDWPERLVHRFPTPERLGSFGFVENRNELVAAFETGFALFDPATGCTEWLARPGAPGVRLNDGRVDSAGRFWVGGMAEERARHDSAKLYCLADGTLHVRESGLTISNSICWSPDGAWFYFADTIRRVIWRYVFDAATGVISGRQVFAETPEGAYPDGSAVDSQGFLWNAQWGAGRIVRYSPDGRIDRILEVPASQPTCVAFGGPDMNLLFVTSARMGLSEEALARQTGAGDVFLYNTEFHGLPEHRYRCPGRSREGGRR
jgi:L-arabinonolactonase